MLFPSIFRVNGEAVVAGVDNQLETTTINGSLQTRLHLGQDQAVSVAAPFGSVVHTCSVAVITGVHAEDIVLGNNWLRQFSRDAPHMLSLRNGTTHMDCA